MLSERPWSTHCAVCVDTVSSAQPQTQHVVSFGTKSTTAGREWAVSMSSATTSASAAAKIVSAEVRNPLLCSCIATRLARRSQGKSAEVLRHHTSAKGISMSYVMPAGRGSSFASSMAARLSALKALGVDVFRNLGVRRENTYKQQQQQPPGPRRASSGFVVAESLEREGGEWGARRGSRGARRG